MCDPLLHRNVLLEKLTSHEFDVVIMGGGATGAGIALDCINRGLTVGLIQSSDFSSGTSSRYPTCLLLQGGINFRETGFKKRSISQFYLDKKAQRERPKYLKISSYLVEHYKIFSLVERNYLNYLYYLFITPFISLFNNQRISFKFLSFFSPFRKFSLGAIQYYDNLQNDSRLNVSLILSAISKGAICLNYCKANKIIENNGLIQGIECTDRLSGKSLIVKSKKIINATGAGCDFIKNLFPEAIYSKIENKIQNLSDPKVGFHLILDKPEVKENTAYIVPKEDGSVVFFIHYFGKTLAGIEDWDHEIKEPLCKIQIQNMINELNKYTFDKIEMENVKSAWTGWRPIMKDHDSIREFIIDCPYPGIYSITGGAWSEYRLMAETITDQIFPNTDHSTLNPIIGSNKLTTNNNINFKEFNLPWERLEKMYGNRYLIIASLCLEDNNYQNYIGNSHFIVAEIIFAVRYELAVRITDILFRRLPIGFLDPRCALSLVPYISIIMAKELNWCYTIQQEEERLAMEELSLFII